PSYRNIKNFSDSIGVKNISAFTATATPEVRKDIVEQLKFQNPSIHISGFVRENISLNVSFEKNKKEKIYELVKGNEKSTIVYASTRKNAEQLTKYLRIKKVDAEFYHAGLSNELRKIIQDDFLNDKTKVIVATNAFGMGIDKSDINLVIHYNIPGSIENLYQEFGRAGRDGNDAKAYLFYSDRDKEIQEFLIKLSFPSYEQIKECYRTILDYHRIAVNNISEKLLEINNELFKLIESKSIPKNLITSILSILEQNKYLKIHTSSSLNHFIQFLLNPNDLKKYLKGMYNPELQEFIIQLIKHFGSTIFEKKVQLDFDFFEKSFSQTRNNIEEFLFTLNNVGIIKYDKPTFSPKVEMLRERVDIKNLRLDKEDITNKILLAENKLNKIVDYVNSTDCRFKIILDYFGEVTENYFCGKCDNCGNLKKRFGNKEYIDEIIIRTFKEYNSALTEQRLIGILKGTSKSIVAKKISTYQNCQHYSASEIEASVQLLLAKNILKNINGELVFNPMEELFSADENEFEFEEPIKNNYENNLELFNKLKEERNLASKKFSQNPQIVCDDKILSEISKVKPKSPSELMQISGFNQRMYNKIGPEFLIIIKEHNETQTHTSNSNQLPKHISQTYELVNKKYSLTEISNLLKLPESIVSIQLETIISYYPNKNYSTLINKDEFEIIKNAIDDLSEDLKSIKQKLKSSLSYSKIRVVKAILLAQKSL
ncbi:MAG: RecQ family ATP-dependent DNA helicase, partial [Ignavibacteriae bacterium]|nr:RecQ family ATP-dependent DNA helicase [Ignavibacteriota bacterium]